MVFISRLPDDKTIEDYQREISAPFARAWHARMEGQADQEEALAMIFGAVPEWFPAIQFVGGPGLVAPGLTSETTLDLGPGNYVLECYVKTAAGEITIWKA